MPAQRFVWLEEMQKFACMAGVLPNADQEKYCRDPSTLVGDEYDD